MRDAFARRTTNGLVAVTLGVYALMLAGVTTAVTDAASACTTWPACGGSLWPLDAALAIALGHRALALLVAGGLIWVAWRCRAGGVPPGVRRAVAVALVLYPVQVGVGALSVGGGTPFPIRATHLVVAVAIFSALVLALSRQLTATTAETESDSTRMAAEPHSSSGGYDTPSSTAPSSSTDGESASRFHDRARSLFPGRSWAYLRMTKPRLMWLLCLVALAAMLLAGGRSVSPSLIAWTLIGGVLAVGASGVFNNVLERDVDERMDRTADRPLVEQRVPVAHAALFGVVLTLLSTAVFLVQVNALAAVLGVLAILSYSVGYTLVLKPNTTQNIVIGGAVGVFPALIGWSAVTGTIGLPTVVLGAVIFLWTPAHFYNLALLYKEEYAAAGFPMLPVVRGEATTRRHILLYLGATMVAVALLIVSTSLDWLFAGAAAVAGGVFLLYVVRLCRRRTDRAARDSFISANAYLGIVLLAIVLDSVVA
ncbi:heme o synthase [Halolamina sp. C58]|uniref:heme o synthase n=1 Tax=Halolamina sp. C58 TaxID=3421640 RepID=UPI003EBD0321